MKVKKREPFMELNFASLNLCLSFLVRQGGESYLFLNKPMLKLCSLNEKIIHFLITKTSENLKQKLNLYSKKLGLFVFARVFDERQVLIIAPYPRLLIFLEPLTKKFHLILERGFPHLSMRIMTNSTETHIVDFVINEIQTKGKLVSTVLNEVYDAFYKGEIKCVEQGLDDKILNKTKLVLALLEREYIPSEFFIFSPAILNEISSYLCKFLDIDCNQLIAIETFSEEIKEFLLRKIIEVVRKSFYDKE